VEAETEDELVHMIQEHMRQDHGMELSRDRVLRDLRGEE
jgi:predicted small metal-binding protein